MTDPVRVRLAALRAQMAERGIDIYVVPTADFHGSEYVGEYFKAREYMTGFTGSAGTAVILQDEAGLWTDGRYFIQAAKQLEGSGVTLYRMGEEGVCTVTEFIRDKLKENGSIGCDGRVLCAKTGEEYRKIAEEGHGTLKAEEDLVDLIWTDRPPLSKEPVFLLEEKYAGESIDAKLEKVREQMKAEHADSHILSSLYDIAWLLNVRGNDIAYVPVVLSYLLLTEQTCIWFLQEDILTEDQKKYLLDHQITTRPYASVYEYVKTLHDQTIWLDKEIVNYKIVHALPEDAKLLCKQNPTEMLKAVKNPVEIKNTIAAHIKDGVAFTKFMYWLKTHIGKETITEISASDYLEERRREQEHFI